MDIASFVADIPSIVEGFVKTARLVAVYHELDSDFREIIDKAIYYADKLEYLTRFIDNVPSTETKPDGYHKVR